MANNSKIVKKANSSLVLNTIRRQKDITIEELIDATGLSRPTVLNILKKLLDDQVVSVSGVAQTDIGRHPLQYALSATSHYAIGIDVDGPPINLVLSDLNGDVRHSASWTIQLSDSGEQIAESILAEIERTVNAAGVSYDQVLGIGIGLPAVVDMAANTAVRISRLARWNNYPLAEVIAQRTGVKVHVRNDAHLLGMAEHSLLADTDNSLYIVHRSGIGMSAMIANNVYEGATGNSGYIGHSTLLAHGRACDCGARGCFEAYCSKRAIVTDYTLQGGQASSYSEVLGLAIAGEPLSLAVLEGAGDLFGIAVSNFIKCFEIYTVILGDMMCDEQHPFFRSIVRSTQQHLNNYSNQPPRILSGKLRSHCFGLGGCHLILSQFFAHPKLRL